jgi:hypothetical protein
MRLSHVLKQFVTPWKPILANTMTSWDFTGMQLTVRQMSLYVTVEIVFTGKRHELSVFSKAARVHTDPSPSINPSVRHHLASFEPATYSFGLPGKHRGFGKPSSLPIDCDGYSRAIVRGVDILLSGSPLTLWLY